MAKAAFLPPPIADITVALPVTTSPAANTPSLSVSKVSLLTIIVPRCEIFTALSSRIGSVFGFWPIAIINC